MINRVLVIGLDSAPLNLLERWIYEGRLPNLANVFSQGAYGVLNSTLPPLSPAAWSSFATGMNPGKHGVFDHGYRQPGTYKIAPTNGRLRGGTTIWNLLSERGKIVGVINVPETYPPEPVNGFMISGMDTPSDDSIWSYPPSLAEELKEAIGGYKVYGTRSKENLDRSIAGMFETIPMRMKAATYLWKKYELNFMILVFMETDVIQHKTWKYMDPSHPYYDKTKANKYGNAILKVYQCIDQHLPLLLDQLDDETALIIMSDHGAGPVDKWLNLNNWLLREKFMFLKEQPLSLARYWLFRAGVTPNNAYRVVSKLNVGLVDRFADQTKRKSSIMKASPFMKIFLSFNDIDWERTRAYTLGGNLTGIWINLKGREPNGCVSPGPEYEQLRDELIQRLKELKDPKTNIPIATSIYRREEIYHGPYLDRAPDIVFETRDEQYVGFGIQEFVTNAIAEPSPVFNGCHRRAGMVVLYGKPFLKGIRLRDHDITDLSPTILYLLNHPIPEDMDGDVMIDALRSDYCHTHPIHKSGMSWKPSLDDKSSFSKEEETLVTEHLRNLGYL